jgi:transcriptional regulator with XRE-family HTH domain
MEIRQESGMTRTELARRSGIGISTIENYERCKILEPSIYKVETLLDAMDYDLDAIQASPQSLDMKKKNKTMLDI